MRRLDWRWIAATLAWLVGATNILGGVLGLVIGHVLVVSGGGFKEVPPVGIAVGSVIQGTLFVLLARAIARRWAQLPLVAMACGVVLLGWGAILDSIAGSAVLSLQNLVMDVPGVALVGYAGLAWFGRRAARGGRSGEPSGLPVTGAGRVPASPATWLVAAPISGRLALAYASCSLVFAMIGVGGPLIAWSEGPAVQFDVTGTVAIAVWFAGVGVAWLCLARAIGARSPSAPALGIAVGAGTLCLEVGAQVYGGDGFGLTPGIVAGAVAVLWATRRLLGGRPRSLPRRG